MTWSSYCLIIITNIFFSRYLQNLNTVERVLPKIWKYKNASLMQCHVTFDDVITMTMQLSCRRGFHSCTYQNWTQSELWFRRYMTFNLCAINLWSKAHTFKFMSRDLCLGFLWDIHSFLNSWVYLLWNEEEKKYDFSFLLPVNLCRRSEPSIIQCYMVDKDRV